LSGVFSHEKEGRKLRKCVGNIALDGKSLHYYVFGDLETGYGIEIVETRVEKANHIVSGRLEPALNLAKQLRRGSVFPASLDEILEDFEI
jgi:hypothetical protein